MYCLKLMNENSNTYNILLIFKEFDKVQTSIYLYNSQVELEAEKKRI